MTFFIGKEKNGIATLFYIKKVYKLILNFKFHSFPKNISMTFTI